jgi:hypothetical protein
LLDDVWQQGRFGPYLIREISGSSTCRKLEMLVLMIEGRVSPNLEGALVLAVGRTPEDGIHDLTFKALGSN